MAPRLRSNVSALDKVPDADPDGDTTAPPSKKRKTKDVPRFHCTSCSTLRMTKFFPNVNPSSECEHLINTCTSCLGKWVAARVESGSFDFGSDGKMFGVRCPECPGLMKEVNVQDATTKKVFQRFRELERRHIADTVPGWRWCLNPKCKAGQVHEKNTETAKTETTKKDKGGKKGKKKAAEEDICTCHTCGHRACFPCDRPDHAPETCAEYQSRTKGRTEEDDKSRAMLLKISKPCPSCRKPIEKAGGCNNMMCAVCHSNFCWECVEVFTATGCACTRKSLALRNAALAAAGLPPIRVDQMY